MAEHPLGKPVTKLPARARACGPSRSPWSRQGTRRCRLQCPPVCAPGHRGPGGGERRKVSSPSRVTMAGEETPRNGWPPYHPAWQPGQAGMPPDAARTEGPPRTRPRRWINRAKRTTPARPLHSPEGAMNQTVAEVQPLLRRLTCRPRRYRAWRGTQPQRRGSGLHGLVDHGAQLGRQGVQVDLVAQPGAERLDRSGSVVAAPVEAPVHGLLGATAGWLDSAATARVAAATARLGVRSPTLP